MTYDEASEHAKIISREYGPTVVFCEPLATESYQVIVSSVPLGATIIAKFDDGKLISELRI